MNADTIVAVGAFLAAVVVPVIASLRRRTQNAAPTPALDPQVPARATKPCSVTQPHRMAVSELGTWWFCQNDGCTEMWPADEAHHIDLPYDREAVQLVDETESFLRRVS